MSFICRSCKELVAEDVFFQSVYIPGVGRVCPECHEHIQHIVTELKETGRFTMVDEDGNIMGIIMEIVNR